MILTRRTGVEAIDLGLVAGRPAFILIYSPGLGPLAAFSGSVSISVARKCQWGQPGARAMAWLAAWLGLWPRTAPVAKSLQSCPTLCDPIDGSPPGSPVPGILQARTLEWVAISFSNA